VAMKDLEIRGAGNLLGGEQSGHVEGVGFDLYVRLVGEAVAAYRGEATAPPAEVKIELPVDAHLPHDYVPGQGYPRDVGERLRLEAYKKLAEVTDEQGVQAIEAELRDRYGVPPEPVVNLFEVARLRTVARAGGLTDISAQGQWIRFGPIPPDRMPESRKLRLTRLYPGSIYKDQLHHILVPRPMTARVGGQPLRDTAVLRWAADVVRAVVVDNVDDAARVATTSVATGKDQPR